MTDQLPAGWSLACIDELIMLNPKNDCADTTEVGFVPMQLLPITYHANFSFEKKVWASVKKGYTHFASGDVLLAKITPCFENGKSGIAAGLPNGLGAGSTEYFVCRPRNGILESRYLLAYLKTEYFTRRAAVEMTGSVGHKRVPKEFLLNELLPLPPAREQQRIADKLDTTLARVEACRERLARVGPLLKRFRQSVLASATSGSLTADISGGSKSDWTPNILENLCISISDGPFGSNLKSDDYTVSGVRVVRLENIGHLFFESSKETYISNDKYVVLKKHTIAAGNLLFSSFVDEEVRVCEFPANLPTAAINKADCFSLQVDPDKCDKKYLLFRLACRTTYFSLKAQVHGATRPRINLRQLKRYELDMPPRNEQEEIVRRVELLFAFADRLEARLKKAQAAADRLTPALLAKAFRGELVPQDPADEPAAELLKRLAAQKASQATTPVRGRRPAVKAVPSLQNSLLPAGE